MYSASCYSVIDILASNCIISGLTISLGSLFGMYINANNIKINDIKILNSNKSAIKIEGSENVNLEMISVIESNSYGIEIIDSKYINCSKSNIYKSAIDGICIETGSQNINIINNCIITGCGRYGINVLSGAQNVNISGDTFLDNNLQGTVSDNGTNTSLGKEIYQPIMVKFPSIEKAR